VDKFVIYDGVFRRAKNYSSGPSFPADHRHRAHFSLKSGNGTYLLGALRDIQARGEACPLCFLVAKSVEKPTKAAETDPRIPNHVPSAPSGVDPSNLHAICHVNWEIDGRDNDAAGIKSRTRRLHLHWSKQTLKDSYLVFVAPQRLFDFNSDAQGSWEKEAFFLGRELRTDGNNQVLMKSWLDQCHQHHGDVCAGDQSKEFVEMATQSYFGVIDVLDMCLKSLPRRTAETPEADSSLSRRIRRDIRIGNRSRSYSPSSASG
jgi:hypothetical protein